MSLLRDFPPHAGAHPTQADWIAIGVGTCGTASDEEYNLFLAVKAVLDTYVPDDDWLYLSWPSWAGGWYAQIFYKPGTAAACVANLVTACKAAEAAKCGA